MHNERLLVLLALASLAGTSGCDRVQRLVGGEGSSTSFSGTYRSNWGTTSFSQQGAHVTAGYPNGTMTCTASGNTLDCDWRQAAASGRAKLTKLPNGNIEGTWGSGTSATNGGVWLFEPGR